MENKDLNKKRQKIVHGLEKAYKNLIEFKKLKNSPVVVAKDGQVVDIDPKEIKPTTRYKWH